MEIIITDRAKADLVSIVEYISQDNVEAANRLKNDIMASLTTLADFPKKGRPGRVSGTRELIIHKSYIAVYSVSKTQAIILTVRHAARLWPNSF